jgi:hypothetical protein
MYKTIKGLENQLYELFVQNNGYLSSNLIRGDRSLYYQLKTMLESGKAVQERLQPY